VARIVLRGWGGGNISLLPDIYRAAGFWRVRRNQDGIETWVRPLRPLRGEERRQIAERSLQHPRSRQRAALVGEELGRERAA
jgi:hypothetical protein